VHCTKLLYFYENVLTAGPAKNGENSKRHLFVFKRNCFGCVFAIKKYVFLNLKNDLD